MYLSTNYNPFEVDNLSFAPHPPTPSNTDSTWYIADTQKTYFEWMYDQFHFGGRDSGD